MQIIEMDTNAWTKFEGLSSKGLRVKSWYERVDDHQVFLYKEPKIYNFQGEIFITQEIWTELIACKIGQYLGLEIPNAYPAKLNGNYGILIKNFLTFGVAGMPINCLVEAKEILSSIKVERPHNIDTVNLLLTRTKNIDISSWEKYLKMLVFDSLIGNNDRHDENWGLLYDNDTLSLQFAPIYDNASCLASGENETRVFELLNNTTKLQKYVVNGKPPNLYINIFNTKHYKHFEIIQYLLSNFDIVKFIIEEMLKYDILDYTNNVVEKIQQLDVPCQYQLSDNRKGLILKILSLRIEKLKDLVNVHD